MQTLGTLLAIHQVKITVYRCTVSQCCSSPCRCNLSVKPCPRAPTMFWLIVPVSPGHLGLPVILHITHICPNKRHTVTEGMRTFRYTRVCTFQVHIAQTWSPAHTKTHKEKMLPVPVASYVKAVHAQTVRQRSRYSLLLMSCSTTRSDGWTYCSLYCLKPSFSPPAVALCLHLGRETVMINALSAGISGEEKKVLLKCFTYIVFIQSCNIHTEK